MLSDCQRALSVARYSYGTLCKVSSLWYSPLSSDAVKYEVEVHIHYALMAFIGLNTPTFSFPPSLPLPTWPVCHRMTINFTQYFSVTNVLAGEFAKLTTVHSCSRHGVVAARLDLGTARQRYALSENIDSAGITFIACQYGHCWTAHKIYGGGNATLLPSYQITALTPDPKTVMQPGHN